MATFLPFKSTPNPFARFLGEEKKTHKPQGKKETTAQPIPSETLTHCSLRHRLESSFSERRVHPVAGEGRGGMEVCVMDFKHNLICNIKNWLLRCFFFLRWSTFDTPQRETAYRFKSRIHFLKFISNNWRQRKSQSHLGWVSSRLTLDTAL